MADYPPELRGDAKQPLVGFRSNPEWEALVAETGEMIAALDGLRDSDEREAVFAALARIDAVHREALHRLVRLFKEGVLEQVVTDPAIKTLMGMYDLLPEPTPSCQKVWDFLPNESGESGVSADPAGEPPHWSPAPVNRPPVNGGALICQMEEGTFVLIRVDDRLYALSAVCPEHGAPMLDGRLEGLSWICPHGPGCLYDIRTGARLGGGPSLACLPLREESGRVLIGFGVPFTPSLPAY